jgi:succinate dehydrogenase / fumarate reductase cytochrome b subunit
MSASEAVPQKRPRPLSPHLQIYRPQISSALSIFHRITGCALAVGSVLLAWWVIAAAAGPAAFENAQWFLGSWLGLLMLFGWSAALFYHLCSGIRHLAWDAGWGYDLPTMHKTGYAVLIATGVLTVLAWIIGLVVW